MRSPNSGWLYSPRRYGKTSLIREAFALVEDEDLHTAYVDLWPIGGGADLIRPFLAGISPLISKLGGGVERGLRLLRSLLHSFVPAVGIDDNGRPVFSVAPAGRLDQPGLEELLDLPERLAERHGARVVIAFDEFQEIAHVKGLEARLRAVMQHQQRVSYLLAGSRASLLRTMLTSPQRPFYQFGEHVPIGRIPTKELVRYVRGRFEWSGVQVREGLAREVVTLAGGHPHFVQYFASVAWNLLAGNVPDDEATIGRVREQVVASLDPGFREIFEGLSAAQRRVLVELAAGGGKELLSEARRTAAGLGSASTVASALEALAAKQILEREAGVSTFLDPAFRLWVCDRVPRARR